MRELKNLQVARSGTRAIWTEIGRRLIPLYVLHSDRLHCVEARGIAKVASLAAVAVFAYAGVLQSYASPDPKGDSSLTSYDIPISCDRIHCFHATRRNAICETGAQFLLATFDGGQNS